MAKFYFYASIYILFNCLTTLQYFANAQNVVVATTAAPISPSQQCPCITVPGMAGCLQFDSRFQAPTLDEAMNSFTDLTLNDSEKATEKDDPECTTEQCKTCKQYLKKKLKDIGMLPATTITSITANSTAQCNKYNFVRKGDIEKKEDSSSEDEDDDDDDDSDSDSKDKKKELLEKREQILKKIQDPKLKDHVRKKLEEKLKFFPPPPRTRRQAPVPAATDQGLNSSVVGTRFKLSCDTKGVATDGSGLLTLCSRCWAWRELPDNYYPRYMNELICDETDGGCLSGYATCGISHRSAYVVRNDSGVLNVITLQSGSFCECRVKPGTALESLVTGTGNGILPTNIPELNGGGGQQQQQPAAQGQAPITNDNNNNNNVASGGGSGFWY